LCLIVLATGVVRADESVPPPSDEALRVERLDVDADFIVSMIADGDGGVFIGTEDKGVVHRDAAGNVTRFVAELGDPNAYALAIDKLGRLWVGNLNSGVSVFSGETWKNYDVIDGPIGERVFDIQLCPVDGDVWIATSAGITRYKLDADEWEHFTREDGLLEDQASSLAFKDDGTLIVGTQCHGLAIFSRGKNGAYTHSKNITAPERFGPNNCSPVPLVPFGDGLPTNQINQVLVASDGVIWIATPTGLVRANDKLTQMQFARGIDYADKVRGLYGGAPKGWQECPPEVRTQLLPEDYITCLAEDASGAIWLGTRQRGFVAIDPQTGRRGTGDAESFGLADNYVSAILPMPDAKPLIGLYIGGVARPNRALTLGARPRTVNTVAKSDFAPLPSPIKPPTVDELRAMQAKLEKLNEPLPKIYAAYYGDDWKTQGDWVGRYGRQYAIMCAVNSPYDRKMYRHQREISVNAFIGPNSRSDDSYRAWIHWLQTDNLRALYDPFVGGRRQAEWNDNGTEYPMTQDGPDLWYQIDVKKEGVYRVSMYVFNKDGHSGKNVMRDYMLEVYPASSQWTDTTRQNWRDHSRTAEEAVQTQEPLAKSRLRNFWGGVYKTFTVTGPASYFVKLDRNYSFNTMLSLVAVDRLVGESDPYDKGPLPWVYVRQNPPRKPYQWELATELGIASRQLWNTILASRDKSGNVEAGKRAELIAFFGATAAAENCNDDTSIRGEQMLVRHITWEIKHWNAALRQEFESRMAESWEGFKKANPEIVEKMNTPRE
ncbi:MAG: ligand-binding sensor domain-containing protein, partial [Thermoguttaceae bacterium]